MKTDSFSPNLVFKVLSEKRRQPSLFKPTQFFNCVSLANVSLLRSLIVCLQTGVAAST